MTRAFRSSRFHIAGALVLAGLAAHCSGGSDNRSGAVGTSGTAPAAIDVRINSQVVTIENMAGQPLLNVQVTVRPVGRAAPFTTSLQRMEPGDRRDLPLGQFVASDNTRFSAFTPPPKDVVVTAVDQDGTRHDVTVPWKR
jgi:hypothetical protein